MAGIINTAAQSVATTPPPAIGAATTYDATKQAPVVNAAATGYTAAQQAPAIKADVAERTVDPDTQTVAGQVKGIINDNSPLLQQARARSQQAANDRGLGNSSIAVGAGEDALYSAALPIATADANVYGNAANLNVTSHNTANLADAAAGNRVNEVNAGATNQASQFGAAAGNQASIINAGAANQINSTDTQSENIAKQFGAAATNTASANQLQAQTQRIISDNSLASSERVAQLQSATQQTIASMQSETQKVLNNATLTSQEKNAQLAALTQANIADAANKVSLANTKLTTDTQTAITLANNASAQIVANISASSQQAITKLDNDNKLLLQTDIGAASLHANAMIAIANIETSTNVSDKAGAVQQVLDNLNNGLAVMGVVGHQLDFSATTTGNGTAPATTQQGNTNVGLPPGAEFPHVDMPM